MDRSVTTTSKPITVSQMTPWRRGPRLLGHVGKAKCGVGTDRGYS